MTSEAAPLNIAYPARHSSVPPKSSTSRVKKKTNNRASPQKQLDTPAHTQTDGVPNRPNSTDSHEEPKHLSANMSCIMWLQEMCWSSLLPQKREAISFAVQSTKALFFLVILGFHWRRNKHLNRKTHLPWTKPYQLEKASTGSYWICHLFASTSTFSAYTTEYSKQSWTASASHHVPLQMTPVTHTGLSTRELRCITREASPSQRRRKGRLKSKFSRLCYQIFF